MIKEIMKERTHKISAFPAGAKLLAGFAALLFLLLPSLTGCTKEESGPGAGNDHKTTITLRLADTEDVSTRSVASANERLISDAYILIFRGGSYFAGEKVDIAADLAGNGGQAPVVTSTLRMAAGDRVAVLCNTGVATLPAFVVGSDTEAAINTHFPSATWNLNQAGAASGQGMPMSGVIEHWNPAVTQVCSLRRSAAKIQVAVSLASTPGDVTGAFTGPDAISAITWGVFNKAVEGNILAPASGLSIPSPVTFINNTGLPQRVVGAVGATPQSLTYYMPEYNNSVRAREAAVAHNVFNADRTCVILSANSGFYRLDLYDQLAAAFIDIHRNFHYTVNITQVTSAGYTTLAEALANPSSNIRYHLTVTDENSNIVASNGQYAIGLSADTVNVFGGARTYDIAMARKIGAPGTVTTNSITVSPGLTLVSPAALTDDMQTIQVSMGAADVTGTVTLRLGNITKTIQVVKRQFQYRQVSIHVVANLYGYGYNISIPGAGSNKVFTSPNNFGINGIFNCEPPVFLYPNVNSDGLLTPNLQAAIDANVDIILLSQDVYINEAKAALLADYVRAGGVLICFWEANGFFDASLQNGSATFLMRAIFNNNAITSKPINYAGNGYNGGPGAIYRLSDINDQILNGPFGDVRGLNWGEDASWARAIGNLPADQVDVYSTGINQATTAQEPNASTYATGFKHKTLNLLFFGDGGFTSAAFSGAYPNLNGFPGGTATINPFYWNTTTFMPIAKPGYGANGANLPVYNSVIFCNVMAWAIERANTNGINTP